MLSSKFNTMHM